METEVQCLTANDAVATNITTSETCQPVKREITDDTTSSEFDCKTKILLTIILLLVAIIIIIVLCGAYAGAFDRYTDCSKQCYPFADESTETVSIPNGNDFDFGTTVCEGYRDIWEDPTLELSQRNQIGRAIFQTPQKMREAIELIKLGKSYDLYRPYSQSMPFAFGRYLNTSLMCGYFPQWSAGSCTLELKSNGIGNIGTQFDSFGHFFNVDMDIGEMNTSDSDLTPPNENYILFNNFRGDQVFTHTLGESDSGVKYLGVEKLPMFFTRAILVDIAGFKKVETVPKRYNITVNDFLGALEAQGLSVSDITQGDVVLVYTGWDRVYDNGTLFYDWDQTPGLSEEVVLDIIFDTNATIIGSDTWGVDNVGADQWGAHQVFLACGGGFVHEMLKLDQWVSDARDGSVPWLGAYMFQPLPVEGGVAAPGKPVVFV